MKTNVLLVRSKPALLFLNPWTGQFLLLEVLVFSQQLAGKLAIAYY